MEKRVVALMFILVFILSIFVSASLVAAQDEAEEDKKDSDLEIGIDTGKGASLFKKDSWLDKKYQLWVKGVKISELTTKDGKIDSDQVDSIGAIIKWAILALIVLLIYSALAFVKFPESATLRLIISIVVGFLATFFITTEELITAMQSYTALGIAMTVFFPIMILGFFTLVVASKANPIGIYLQRILWLIYSIYLFFRAGILLLLKNAYNVFDAAGKTTLTAGTKTYWGFINVNLTQGVINSLEKYDTTMLITLVVVAIAVFIIMVISNKPIIAWFAKEKREAEIEGQKATIARSKAYDKARSEAMQDQ